MTYLIRSGFFGIARHFQRLLSLSLALTFITSLVMTTTLAQSRLAQHKSNELTGYGLLQQPVQLTKYEKHLDGTPTDHPIKGAEFYLYRVGEAGDQQVGGRFVTNASGIIIVNGLPAGDYYFVETKPPYGFLPDIDDGQNEITRYDFSLVEKQEGIVKVVAYNRRQTGELALSKTVENADGSPLTAEQTDAAFVFTVVFSDGGSYHYTTVDAQGQTGAEQELQSGETLHLRHGETAVFDEIPVGVGYTITEAPEAGYILQGDHHSGTITPEGNKATFINRYDPDAPAVTKLIVRKQLAGDYPKEDEEKEFWFTVIIDGKTERFSLKNGESKEFNLPAGAGYSIEEEGAATEDSAAQGAAQEQQGATSSTDEHTAEPPATEEETAANPTGPALATAQQQSIVFLSAGGGQKAAEPAEEEQTSSGKEETEKQSSSEPDIPPAQSEKEDGPGSSSGTEPPAETEGEPGSSSGAEPPAETEGEPGSSSGAEPPTETEGEPGSPNDAELPSTTGQEAGPALFAGEWQTVVEDDYTADHYIPSQSMTQDQGVIEVVQTNTYIGRETVDISGEKRWNTGGETPQLPPSITVYLKDGGRVVDTAVVKPDGDGDWLFTFTVPKYDDSGAEIQYTVEEELIDGWKPSIEGFVITNTYQPKPPPPPKLEVTTESAKVQKKITGDTPPKSVEFQFQMVATGSAPMPAGAIGSRKTISITGQGEADFGKITFTAPGDYHYTISEIDGRLSGYSYDRGSYTLTISVEEQGGTLQVTSKKLTKTGESSQQNIALFTNRYEKPTNPPRPPSDKITISGEKIWRHGSNQPKNYPQSITVYIKDGNKVVIQKKITAQEHWSWSFTLARYDAQGNRIHYTVEEAPVPGYRSEADGYDLINTYTGGPDGPGGPGGPGSPGSPNGPGGGSQGKPPATGDSAIAFWAATMMVSGMLLTMLVAIRLRNRHKPKYLA